MKVTVITFREKTGAVSLSSWIDKGWKPHFPAMPVLQGGYVYYHLTLTYEAPNLNR